MTQQKKDQPRPQRRPTADDMPAIMEMISDGKSLRSACEKLGLHVPSTNTFIRADAELGEQYARACEDRADAVQEDVLIIAKAAALGHTVEGRKVDAGGARVLIEAAKWAIGRMAPKREPVRRMHVQFEDMTSDARLARIAELQGRIRPLLIPYDPEASDG